MEYSHPQACNGIFQMKNEMTKLIFIVTTLMLIAVPVVTSGDVGADDQADVQNAENSEGLQPSETSVEPDNNDAADLAQKLSNPLAAMISFPMQLNYDQDFGELDTGDRFLMNVQPVIPISISEDWNIISRTIMPLVTQNDIVAGSGRQTGVGDTTQSLWFSPVEPTDKGLIWGVGSVILIPTATDPLLGSETWGLGPTVVGLRQIGPWTIGGLANHIWSVGGNNNRLDDNGSNDVNSTYIQPFLNYNTPSAITYAVNLESSYDWETEQWSIPINLMVSKLKRFDNQMVSFQGGIRYWLKSTDGGPEGWGLRFAVTLLFPK
jgi:hypothetical protein